MRSSLDDVAGVVKEIIRVQVHEANDNRDDIMPPKVLQHSTLDYDLGLDILDITDAIIRIEDEFNVSLPEELELAEALTVSGLTEIVMKAIRERDARPPWEDTK